MPKSICNFFETYIRAYDLFSDMEIATIMSLTIPRSLKKKQYLLRQNNVCRFYTFVCSGCLRSYRIDDYGREHILGLSPVNHWVNDLVSLSLGAPSNEFIDALEDSTIIQLSKDSYSVLLENIPNFNELNIKIISDDCIVSRDRIYKMLSLQAEERYRQFIRTFPELHERIPMYMIASYLGVARETLTRIRRNMTDI